MPSKRRLLGIDRSGPLPSQTRRGAPLHPWTLPNLVGYLRPYHEPTLLADCEIDDGSSVMSWDDAVTAGLVQAMLYCYEEGAGYISLATSGADDDHLRSGCGYWLLNESGGQLILRIPW